MINYRFTHSVTVTYSRCQEKREGRSSRMEQKNLTIGNAMQQLIGLMIPLIGGNILQQLYNTIDAFVIGRYAGSLEFAAVGVAGSVMNIFLFAIVGACIGISVIFSQQYGADNLVAFRREHFIALVTGLIVSVLCSSAGILFLPAVLQLIQTPDEILGYVQTYLVIVLLGLPATFLYNLYSALLRSVGDAKAALVVLALAVAANLGLDILFIAYWNMGVRGAALATVLAQVLSVVMAVWYLYHHYPALLFHRNDCQMDKKLLQKTLQFTVVTGLQQSGLYIGKFMVQGAVNTGGTDLISAYTATTRIEGFANSFGDSGASATSVMVAQNIGADQQERVREIFWKSLILLFVFGSVCSFVMYLLTEEAVTLLLGYCEGAAYESACQYLRIISLVYVFCFIGNTFAGYFDGCGKVSIPFIGAISHITLRAVLSWIYVSQYGLNAVAVATGIGWVLMNVFWSLMYRKQRLAL